MTEEARKIAKSMHLEECEDCAFHPTRLGCRWRREGTYCDTNLHRYADLIESLSAQLDQVTQERDAPEDNKFQYETGFVKGFEAAQPKWISVKERLPKICELVLVIASGKPKENVKLIDAVIIASYWGDVGWIADAFDGWGKLNVTHWMPLPDPQKEDE